MVDLAEVPKSTREQIEEIGAADLVIGILSPVRRENVATLLTMVQQSVSSFTMPPNTVLVHSVIQQDTAASPKASDADPIVREIAGEGLTVRALAVPLFSGAAPGDPVDNLAGGYRALLGIAENLGSRACAGIASSPESLTPEFVHQLIAPMVELDFDLATPCYAHRKFEGLLNSGVLAPLMRSLYGKRVRHPLGPDFGLSGRLVHHLLKDASKMTSNGRPAALPLLIAAAVQQNFTICETYLGERFYAQPDLQNPSSILAQVLGPVFAEIERTAPLWQRIRQSEDVPPFGQRTPLETSLPPAINSDSSTDTNPDTKVDAGVVDTRRMIESFQLGFRNLPELWSVVLPPTTLLELSRMSRLEPSKFRISDTCWARIIYDFALGRRVRVMNTEHLLRALTPLYLAWVASFVLETESASPEEVERRLEKLAVTFETEKPYLLSRWRWPDRFNP